MALKLVYTVIWMSEDLKVQQGMVIQWPLTQVTHTFRQFHTISKQITVPTVTKFRKEPGIKGIQICKHRPDHQRDRYVCILKNF